ncbi:MAG: metal ABC transporter permease [Thiobacillaceae bacterium]|jgi:zinc/manganese transport system permease protein|nr:metal ABC transporter permease [Thiobacillaceae bacterium]
MNAGIEWGILLPAWLAGLLVLASHVPLGQRVLERGIIFIDIAIAQFAGLGIIVAHFLDWQGGWQRQAAALALAAAGALLLHGTERRWPHLQEAIIGVSFVLVASVAILLLAHAAHGGEHLREMLVGQILWTSWDDLPPLALVSALVLLAWFGGLRKSALGFYLLFALAITASVQVVGVYLVFASLIVPALVAHAMHGGRALLVGYLTGAVGYALGLLASARWDLPAGAVIVCALVVAGCALAAWRWALRPAPG